MRALSLMLALVTILSAPLSTWARSEKQPQEHSDDQIYNEVKRRLATDADVQGGAFDVDVHGGVVTLKGVVEKDKFKTKAERLTKHVKGVTSVDNQLRIGPRGVPAPK